MLNTRCPKREKLFKFLYLFTKLNKVPVCDNILFGNFIGLTMADDVIQVPSVFLVRKCTFSSKYNVAFGTLFTGFFF